MAHDVEAASDRQGTPHNVTKFGSGQQRMGTYHVHRRSHVVQSSVAVLIIRHPVLPAVGIKRLDNTGVPRVL